MATASARSTIFDGGPFGGLLRSRSGDADWDFFPFGRRGRGYRVSEDDLVRLRRLERIVLWVAFLSMLGAAVVLADQLPVPVAVHVRFYMLFAVLLVAKPGLGALAAWLVRRNAAAERPFVWAEMWEPAVAAKPSLRSVLIGMLIPTALAAAAIAAAVALSFQAMAEIDAERRWFSMIAGVFFVVAGIHYAREAALFVRLYLAGRRPQAARPTVQRMQ